jgi:hypothetical protein
MLDSYSSANHNKSIEIFVKQMILDIFWGIYDDHNLETYNRKRIPTYR